MDKKREIALLNDNYKFKSICKRMGHNPSLISLSSNTIFYPRSTNPRKMSIFLYRDTLKPINCTEYFIGESSYREICDTFNAEYEDFYFFEDIIALPTPKSDLFVLIDRNFIPFALVRTAKKDLKRKAYEEFHRFSSLGTDETFHFPEPFASYTLGELLRLSSRISVVQGRCGNVIDKRKLFVTVNKDTYILGKGNRYAEFLSYVSYLGECAKMYLRQIYPLLLTESLVEYRPLEAYLKKVIEISFYGLGDLYGDTDFTLPSDALSKALGQSNNSTSRTFSVDANSNLLDAYYKGTLSMDELNAMAMDAKNVLEMSDSAFRTKENPHTGYRNEDDLMAVLQPQNYALGDRQMTLAPR